MGNSKKVPKHIKYSVVIATYNRSCLLHQCLNALTLQTIPKSDFEIIVTNDGSTDSTKYVLEKFKKENPELNFSFYTQENSGPSKARNLGIKKSIGDIIFFTDDDCVVPENWIETLSIEYIKNPNISGVGGWYEFDKLAYSNKISQAYINLEELGFMYTYKSKSKVANESSSDKFYKNPAGNTSNMSYRKEILINNNGFDEKIDFVGWVDWDLKKRIMDQGLVIKFIHFNVRHLKPLKYRNIFSKFFNRGRGLYNFVSKNENYFVYYYPFLDLHNFNSTMAKLFEFGDLNGYRYTSSKFRIYTVAALRIIIGWIGWQFQQYKNENSLKKFLSKN